MCAVSLRATCMFTCITWNVLADAYTRNPKSFSCPSSTLEWKFRKVEIAKVLTTQALTKRTAIFCLQEVDHYETFYQPLFQSLHYTCVYIPRPNRPDGLLIAWKTDEFLPLGSVERCNLNDLCTEHPPEATERLTKNNIGACVLLKSISCGNNDDDHVNTKGYVIIANVHLYWNPLCPDIKLLQLDYFCRYLRLFQEKHMKMLHERTSTNSNTSSFKRHDMDGLPSPLALILMGDLNSLPDSDVYRYLNNTNHLKSLNNSNNSTHSNRYSSSGADRSHVTHSPHGDEQRAPKKTTKNTKNLHSNKTMETLKLMVDATLLKVSPQ